MGGKLVEVYTSNLHIFGCLGAHGVFVELRSAAMTAACDMLGWTKRKQRCQQQGPLQSEIATLCPIQRATSRLERSHLEWDFYVSYAHKYK